MKLTEDWKDLFRAHSVRALILMVAFHMSTEVLVVITDGAADLSPKLVWIVDMILLAYGLIGRFINQRDDNGKIQGDKFWPIILAVVVAVGLIMTLSGMGKTIEGGREPPGITVTDGSPPPDDAVLDVAIPLVKKWEGYRPRAYQDIVGVWTICYGETDGVVPGEVRTEAQCEQGLRRLLPRYGHGWYRHLTMDTLEHRLTPHRAAAFWSFAYNVGIAGAGRSTATKRLNAGDIKGACAAMGWWNKAGGRVVRGLVNRRAEETAYCLRGL